MTAPPVLQEQNASARSMTRRSFLGFSAAAALGGLAVYSSEGERHELDVVHRTIYLAGLPDSFAGFRIAQLSDIHFEEYTEPFFLEEAVRHINTLHPDLVSLTGDFVSNGPLPAHLSIGWSHECARILDQLHCPLRYAVLGNHDVLVNAVAVTEALASNHIPVLSNSYVPLERDGSRIWLSGLAEVLFQHPNLTRALPAQRDAAIEPVILMVHEPDYADRIVGHQVALVLSGHTHGGQVRIPFMPPMYLPEMGTKYVEGLFHLPDATQLYVNRGIGTVGVPFRFRCPPEITVHTLQPAGRVSNPRVSTLRTT